MWKVTGVDVYGKRFKPIITESAMYAFGINLYRGSVWEQSEESYPHWKLVHRVYN